MLSQLYIMNVLNIIRHYHDHNSKEVTMVKVYYGAHAQ